MAEGEDVDAEVDGPAGRSHLRTAIIAGVVVVAALGALTGWLGYRAHESRDVERQRAAFLQVGSDVATDLTTLDYQHVDADVQRILDAATGSFYDEFDKRASSFADAVRQLKSSSVGTVSEAALEPDDTPTSAHVMVAVVVRSQIKGQPAQEPRMLRIRLEVQRVDDDTKVSDVEYVQ